MYTTDLTGKKEEESDMLDDTTTEKPEHLPSKAKPLTELSKKAEEEVNHLSRNPDLDKVNNMQNKLNHSEEKGDKKSSTTNKSTTASDKSVVTNDLSLIFNDKSDESKPNPKDSINEYILDYNSKLKNKISSVKSNEHSRNYLNRINETLQILDKTSPDPRARSLLKANSRRFLNKLQKQILSMSPTEAQVVEERGKIISVQYLIPLEAT